MKNKEETVLITAVDNGSTVELEINTTLPHEETKEMLAGAVCADITLDTLAERVKELKYHGVGEGIIVATRAG